MADVKLLPSSVAAFTEALHGERGSLDAWLEVHDEREVRAHVEAYARANVAHATAALQAEVEALRAEVERLWGIMRPKREKECLTLDHWRTRAYYLEENWSRCSRACAIEQTKREEAEARADKLRAEVAEWKRVAAAQAELHGEAEARAERLAEALRKLEDREQSDDALLRQALEALEQIATELPWELTGLQADTIAALRERLAKGTEQKA